MHQGYEPRSIDFLDEHKLAERFGWPIPDPLRRS